MKRPVYLDNAATSFPKPRAVIKAIQNALENIGGSPGRGGHKMALTASRTLFSARMAIAELLGLKNPERIVFTKNATEGMNIALKGLLREMDNVAISHLEHNSVIRPLKSLEESRGIGALHAPADRYGLPDPARIPDVSALVTTGASNVTGAVADIRSLGKRFGNKKTLLIVDAAQTAGSIPFDTAGVDALICAGHKGLLGPQGTGFVWFAEGVDPIPLIEGGTGSESASDHLPSYWPDRFEAGTPNTPGIAGLKAGVEYIARRGIEAIREKEKVLCAMIIERLANDSSIILYPPFDLSARASLVTFNIKGEDPSEVAEKFSRQGIALRAGLHCAPSAHRFLGTFPEGAVRVSPGPTTTKTDIKSFFTALDSILKNR